MNKEEKELPSTARLVRHGAYQYVLLPKGFEFDGDHVLIDRYRGGVLLKPVSEDQAKPGKRARNR